MKTITKHEECKNYEVQVKGKFYQLKDGTQFVVKKGALVPTSEPGGGGSVESVNGKTGVVVLDASDVGALPDDTPIPAAVTEQTVSGWGFTKNTGTYVKPSTGIPASDLAAGVIPDISGKANAADVYTKTEVDQKLVGAMDYKGTKATVSALPTSGNETGDVWHITADGSEWAWNGSAWEELGSAVDLSGYRTASAQDAIDTTQDSAIAAKYTKPSGGIPASDLASGVQTSLGKADTALQSHQSLAAYRTASAQDEIDAAQDAAIAAKYTKPSTGIPKTDLASDVKASLGKADTALQTAPVTSVNNKTGAVTLTASDVGALPDSTVIPPTVTEQTVAGWGFTKNTGTYSKPSGGIPKSDLASAVQTSLGKADTAVQPSAISDMATQTYVQTQIAAIPDELPAVTASDNGKFLRVVNGAWAAATVPAAESNSFGGGS